MGGVSWFSRRMGGCWVDVGVGGWEAYDGKGDTDEGADAADDGIPVRA